MNQDLYTIGEGIYGIDSDVFILDDEIKDFLIDAAHMSKRRRSRICLHPSPEAHTQEMIICLLEDSDIPVHSHPQESCESYHVIYGDLNVEVYRETEVETHILECGCLYWQSGGIWHRPYSNDVSIYHEVLYGPFSKCKMILQ